MKEREHAVGVAEKIVGECRRPLVIEGRNVTASASIGLAYGEGSADGETLLKRADAALYEAKAAGRDCYRVAG